MFEQLKLNIQNELRPAGHQILMLITLDAFLMLIVNEQEYIT